MAEIVNLKDFLRTLKLGRIHLGRCANDVAAILGEPEDVGAATRKHRWPPSWKYGDIELLLANSAITVIFNKDPEDWGFDGLCKL